MDVERAFGILVSSWHLLLKLFLFQGTLFCALVVETAIIMNYMVVEARQDGYESQFFTVAEEAVKKVNNVHEDENEKPWDGVQKKQ